MPSSGGPRRKFRRLAADERRQDLIQATLDCLSRFGPHGTGVREICAQAGVSPGLLRHYFDGKDELILEAFRTVTRDFHEDVRGILEQPGLSASQRLRAFVDAYLSMQVTDEKRSATYLAFWTLARTDPAVRRIQRTAYRKLRTILSRGLAALARERGARVDERQAAVGLIALLDGLWLEMRLDPVAFSPAAAGKMAWQWLEGFLRAGPSARARAASGSRGS